MEYVFLIYKYFSMEEFCYVQVYENPDYPAFLQDC